MKLFKKSTAIILMICMVVSTCFLTACSSDKDKDNKSDSSKKENSSAADTSKSDSSKEDSSKEDSSKEDSSEAEKPAPVTDAKLGSKWDSKQFSIDGKVFTLPCKLSDLKAIGFEPTSNGDFIINPKQGAYGTSLKNAKDVRITGTYYNFSDKALPLTDCSLADLSVDTYTSANKTFNIIFPGNITLNSTKDDVIKAYGTPTKMTDEKDSSLIFINYENSNHDKLEIQISRKTGTIRSYYRTIT